MMERIQQYLSDNPVWAGFLITGIGIALLLGAIFDWDFFFGSVNPANYNPRKIDGLINLFGRKTARVVCGFLSIVVMAGGVFWIWAYLRK